MPSNTPKMEFEKDGVRRIPLKIFTVNGTYVLAVYQGFLSELDLLLRYRQKIKQKSELGFETFKWSRIRTPKHIHWAVDLLMKMSIKKHLVEDFLTFLIEIWNKTIPHKSIEERDDLLNSQELLRFDENEMRKFNELNNYGEYSVKFLMLMATLLMQQEKNNKYDAYMFKNLLEALKRGDDIFRIVYTATHSKR